MTEPDPKYDEAKFNETLKRMLKTPPKPQDKVNKDKRPVCSDNANKVEKPQR